jgi:nitrite reductase/ring-hydroxylating ferredoxin subunit
MVRLDDPPFHVLVAIVGDAPFAIEDACNHAGASLSEGGRCGGPPEAAEEDRPHVACPMHGYIFELRTGRLVAPRGLCGDQRRLSASFEGDDVVVWDPGARVAVIAP